MTADTGALTAGAITNTMLAFTTFMPKPSDILESVPGDRLRVNDASAAVVSVGLGVALSIVSRSGAPLVGAMLASALLIAGYEYLARTTDDRITARTREGMANVRI